MQLPASSVRAILNSISSLNHILNETIDLIQMVNTDCPDCTYDPIRQESTNPYCQTCDGKGVIQTQQKFTIASSVETEEDMTYQYRPVGRLVQGEIKATIDKTEISSTLDPKGQFNMDDQGSIKAFLDQYAYVIWKGATYIIEEFQGQYLQGNFYEIDLTLKLKDAS